MGEHHFTSKHTDKKQKALSKQIVFCHANAPVIKFLLGDPDERLEQCSVATDYFQ